MRNHILTMAIVAGLHSLVGSAMDGQNDLGLVNSISAPRLAPPATRRASSTHSAYVSPWGYANGPGWSAAHVQRMATKRRNQARNKSAHRARAS